MSLFQTKSIIENFIQNNGSRCLVIKGLWGVGKTFFWKETVQKYYKANANNRLNYSYVSLFGINSLTALKNAIIASQIISLADNTENKDFDILEQTSIIKNLSGDLLSEISFQVIKNAMICFDDLERKSPGLNVLDLLGLASLLKEQQNCKVVFILNDENLNETDKLEFSKHNEKIVDIELIFAPSPGDVFGYIFQDSFNYLETVRKCCINLKIKNARILARIKDCIEQLSFYIKDIAPALAQEVIYSIILFVWSYYDKDNKDVVPLSFIKDFSRFKFQVDKLVTKDNISPQVESYYELLSKYGYELTDSLDKQLIFFVENGFLPEEFVQELKAKNDKIGVANNVNSYKEVWRYYRCSFDTDENEFVERLEAAFRSNAGSLGFTDLYNVVSMLRSLKKGGRANALIDEFLHQKIDYEGITELKRFPHFSDYTDEYFLKKLDQIHPSIKERRAFSEVVQNMNGDDFYYPPFITELAGFDNEEYYDFIRTSKDREPYYLIKTLLKVGDPNLSNQTEERGIIHKRTLYALKKIAAENSLNKKKISDWFQLKFDELEEINVNENKLES